jgi:phospholipid transport system substrate-binding protein
LIRAIAILTSLTAVLAQGPAAAQPGPTPHQVIQSTADDLLVVMRARRSQLEKDPGALYEVVDDVLRPHFDIAYAGRLVMGKYWPRSTPEQRQRFIDALYDSLVRRYARGLLDYEDDTVRVLPHPGLIELNEDFVTVKTEVRTTTGTTVPVDYRTRWTDGGWKVFDVIIEGLSYVSHYRDLMGEDMRQNGIDAVIEELEAS